MKKRILAALPVLAALLAADARAQDGGGGAPPVPPVPPAAAAKKAPKDPPRTVAVRIEDSLKSVFSGSAAARLAARASLEASVEEWAADAKDDPLRAAKWWRSALAGTLPSANRRSGLTEEKYEYLENREARLWASVPKSYSPKSASPMLLVILDRGEDPKRVLPMLYGDLQKDWIVVAVVADPKEAGIDVAKEPWLAGVGLKWAIENLRVDRDRVVLDATGATSNLALSLGAEWAVQFAGCVLRGPTASSPLLSNLALGGTLFVTPEAMTEPQRKVLDEVRTAVPAATVVAEGKTAAESVQKWIAGLPPRRIAAAETTTFSWKSRPQDGEPWGYWIWKIRAGEAKKERLVSATFTRDPVAGTVDIASDNLAEGILLLNDDLLDLDRPVAVRVNGREVWTGKAERRLKTALYWIGQTGERTLWAPAEIRFTVPSDAQAPPAPKKEAGASPPPPPADGTGKAPAGGGAPPAEPPKKEAPATPATGDQGDG